MVFYLQCSSHLDIAGSRGEPGTAGMYPFFVYSADFDFFLPTTYLPT